MFTALVPLYEKLPEKGFAPDGKAFNWLSVSWNPRGIVQDLDEARQKYGRNVVLEWIGRTH